jgi:hypothetical protein
MGFREFINEKSSNIKGFDYNEIEKRLKDKEEFTVDLTKVEAYDIGGSNGYIVKYKGTMIFSEKKGILLEKLGYNDEVGKLAEIISKVFKVKVEIKDYDQLDKAWLKIWKN